MTDLHPDIILHMAVAGMDSDRDVALLYEVGVEEVPAFRELCAERAEEIAAESGQRVVGLLLMPFGRGAHRWTESEHALATARLEDGSWEFSAAEVAATLGLSTKAVEAHRHGNDHAIDKARQQRTLEAGAGEAGNEWTEREDRFLQEFAGPLEDACLVLRRSYYAVINRRVLLRKRRAS